LLAQGAAMQKIFWRIVKGLETAVDWAKNTTVGQIVTVVVTVIIGLIVALISDRLVVGFAVTVVLLVLYGLLLTRRR
jgi:hypothetical protein